MFVIKTANRNDINNDNVNDMTDGSSGFTRRRNIIMKRKTTLKNQESTSVRCLESCTFSENRLNKRVCICEGKYNQKNLNSAQS